MEYWSLPGADAFMDSVRSAVLEDGKNVIVALPETPVPDLAETLAVKLHQAGAREVCHHMADGRALDVILYTAAALPVSAPVADLAQAMCESRPFLIEAIGPETAAPSLRFLQDYADASRNLERSNPLVVITLGLPQRDLPDNIPKLTTIAWDGWIGEADTLAFIVHHWRQQERTFAPQSRLCARIICNLALWDLALAERLLALVGQNWHFLLDLDRLQACIGEAAPGGMLRTWESGGLARFDGDEHEHLYTFADGDERRAELIRRLWAAQAAHLLPVLEKRRRALVQKMNATGKLCFPMILNGESVSSLGDLEGLEFGGLMSLAQTCKLPQSLIRYADKLRHLRNRLAHLKPLGANDANLLLMPDPVPPDSNAEGT